MTDYELTGNKIVEIGVKNLAGEPYEPTQTRLKASKVTKTADFVKGVNSTAVEDDFHGVKLPEEPEQFNAFCSLDTIEEHLRILTAVDKELAMDVFRRSVNYIYKEVYDLRAYFTGMEK